MNTRKLLVKLVALACCGAVSGVAMATTQEEINKQVSNMIGSAIGKRVATIEPKAAVKDFGGYGGLVNVSVEFQGTRVNADAFYGGADTNLTKDLIGGSSLWYASYTGTNSYGINPYLAYLLNSNFFILGKLDLSDTNSPGSRDQSYGVDFSVNGFKKYGDLMAKAALGVGQHSSTTKTLGAGGTTTKRSHTAYEASGELGYTVAPTWQILGGLNGNTTNRANSQTWTASLGVEKEVAKDAAIGLKYSTNVGDNQLSGVNLKINVVTLSGRFRF